jgi:hypothetical protein
VALVPAPRESDEADRVAVQYFRSHADRGERFLVYNGGLYDVTLRAANGDVEHDSERVKAIVKARKPMIVFHNHAAEGDRAAMFPSRDDFGVAARIFESRQARGGSDRHRRHREGHPDDHHRVRGNTSGLVLGEAEGRVEQD